MSKENNKIKSRKYIKYFILFKLATLAQTSLFPALKEINIISHRVVFRAALRLSLGATRQLFHKSPFKSPLRLAKMTKLIKPLSFSSSIYYDVASIVENTDLKNL